MPCCGVCGTEVYPDDDHVVIDVEHRRMRDRNEEDTYYLHDRCARSVFQGWWDPA